VKRVRGPGGRFLTAAEKESADEDASYGLDDPPGVEECFRGSSMEMQHQTEEIAGLESYNSEAWKYAHESQCLGVGQVFSGMTLPPLSELDSRNNGHHSLSV